jgi:glycosyltransferase involved in cell wall biosynthesis
MTALRIGIGIATYNRRARLAVTLENVFRNTDAHADIVVADDGSTDGTAALLQTLRPRLRAVIAGENRGVAWNKNRLLFFLVEVCKSDVVILLEDDTCPLLPDWEQDWIAAARRHGHIAYAAPWFASSFISGTGKPEDPFESENTTAQCAAFTREAVSYVGYMDTRFGKGGAEHVEHSMRMLRAGFGGRFQDDAHASPVYYLLNAPLYVTAETSYFTDPVAAAISVGRVCELARGSLYRAAWSTDDEYRLFRQEIETARNQDNFKMAGETQPYSDRLFA